MTLLKTYKYIFSFLLLFCALNTSAQDNGVDVKERLSDSVPFKLTGIRVGYDLGNYGYQALLKGFFEQEVQVEFTTSHPVIPVVELGTGITNFDEDTLYNYHAVGSYGKIGVEWNKRGKNGDVMGFGVRYGYGFGKHEITDAEVLNENFTDEIVGLPLESYSGHWIELLYTLKVELLRNFYLGWSVRGKLMLVDSNSNFDPYFLNGFGKMNRVTSAEMNYYISYHLSF